MLARLIIKLLSVFLLTSTIYAQTRLVPADYDPRGKVYLDSWIEAPRVVMKGGEARQAGQRKLKVKLVGPRHIGKGTSGSFYLDLIPEYGMVMTYESNAEAIDSISLNMVTDEGFIEFRPKPHYWVITENDIQQLKPIRDVSKEAREVAMVFGAGIPAVMKVVPKVGKLISLGENVLATSNWYMLEEPDWEKIWDFNSDYDIYPILKPRFSEPNIDLLSALKLVRTYTIELPFDVVGDKGSLSLHLESVVVESINRDSQGNEYGYTNFKDFTFKILDFGKPTKQKKQLIKNEKHFKSENRIETRLSTGLSIDVTAELMLQDGRNVIRASLQPKTQANQFVIIDELQLAVEIPKGTGRLAGMPTFYDHEGKEVRYYTIKEQGQNAVLFNWIEFGYGLFRFIGTAISAVDGIANVLQAYELAKASISFSESMRNLWDKENKVNFYQFPPLINKTDKYEGFQGWQVEIPVDFFSQDISNINLYVNGQMQFGPSLHQWNRDQLAGSSVKHVKDFRFAKRIPLEFKDAKTDINRSILLILDTSTSMDEKISGGTISKLDAAKQAIYQLFNSVSRKNVNNEWALMIFRRCNDTPIIQTFTTNPSLVINEVRELGTYGQTPLAHSIKESARYLISEAKGREAEIVILTDGIETCKGDPVEEARKLVVPFSENRISELLKDVFISNAYASPQSGSFKISLSVISLDTAYTDQLMAIATAAGGNCYEATNLEELSSALTRATMPESKTSILLVFFIIFLGGVVAIGGYYIINAQKSKKTKPLFVGYLVVDTDGSMYEYPVHSHQNIRIGRANDNDIVIEDKRVSQHHAEISYSKVYNCFAVKDLNSTNGTYLNEEKVEQNIFSIGDELKVVDVIFRFVDHNFQDQ